MIAEAFLTCALAVPAAMPQYHLPFDKDDIKVVKMITDVIRQPHKNKRILIVGSETEWEWVVRLRNHGFSAWRLVRGAVAQWDIEGSAFHQPILPESLRMVFCLLPQPQKVGNIKMLVDECERGIEYLGFFVFDELRTPRFKDVLSPEIWVRLPFRWHSMLMYQKVSGKRPIPEGSPDKRHGWWEVFLKASLSRSQAIGSSA